MDEKQLYEEYNILPTLWGWVVLIAFSAMIIGSAFIMHFTIRDRPREWSFGQLPHTPAASIYSSQEPPAGRPVPEQFPVLPEARPLPAQAGDRP